MPLVNTILLEGIDDNIVNSLIDGSEKKHAKKPDFMLEV
ncbi:hypothetical protein INT46_001141 [Mucor plumbeus]|uniref:Uncharacterized protein n=1 Tax=Mucor plumbeus TaxID=97098 RepID=A0A8H7V4K4_9FUNG|nr:hypothetical protein INT46_001141 [Mucor plumbeus]